MLTNEIFGGVPIDINPDQTAFSSPFHQLIDFAHQFLKRRQFLVLKFPANSLANQIRPFIKKPADSPINFVYVFKKTTPQPKQTFLRFP